MANILGRPEIKLQIALELDEGEARALHLICDYDHEHFLKLLYAHIGERLVDEHKEGILSLLETARPELSRWLSRVDKSREIFTKMSGE